MKEQIYITWLLISSMDGKLKDKVWHKIQKSGHLIATGAHESINWKRFLTPKQPNRWIVSISQNNIYYCFENNMTGTV